jgi:hypothetical protein
MFRGFPWLARTGDFEAHAQGDDGAMEDVAIE